ncbi:ScpA family protein [Rhodospirillales bacterium]|nr:ScpA family protein [Rhodospirillales bacterium]
MNKEIEVAVQEFEDNHAIEVDLENSLIVDVGGYEGPIDILLTLAREQKVDLKQISILDLVDQYLIWVVKLQNTNLELAADYLVMAAWLAYLKSRLIIPEQVDENEPTGEEMAEALQFQLLRLESMQDAGSKIVGRLQLGVDFFKREDPEVFGYNSTSIYDVTMFELLSAYGEHTHRSNVKTLHIQGSDLFSAEDAIKRLMGKIGQIPNWSELEQFLPIKLRGDIVSRSAMAATFMAALQMTKEGKIQIQQRRPFDSLFLKDFKRHDQIVDKIEKETENGQ